MAVRTQGQGRGGAEREQVGLHPRQHPVAVPMLVSIGTAVGSGALNC